MIRIDCAHEQAALLCRECFVLTVSSVFYDDLIKCFCMWILYVILLQYHWVFTRWVFCFVLDCTINRLEEIVAPMGDGLFWMLKKVSWPVQEQRDRREEDPMRCHVHNCGMSVSMSSQEKRLTCGGAFMPIRHFSYAVGCHNITGFRSDVLTCSDLCWGYLVLASFGLYWDILI